MPFTDILAELSWHKNQSGGEIKACPKDLKFSADNSLMDIGYYKRINWEFAKKTGRISNVEELEALGLIPRNVVGTFFSRDAKTLLQFCDENPEYHIITRVSTLLTLNKFLALEGSFYALAKGDPDPELRLEFPQEVQDYLDSELNLLVRSFHPPKKSQKPLKMSF